MGDLISPLSVSYSLQIQKQIHFFLLAFRADSTALSVCTRLFTLTIDVPVSMSATIILSSNDFLRVTTQRHSPSLDIRVDALSLCLNIDDSLVLLFDKHGHLREHLRQLCEGLFDLLDLGMSFLDLAVCASGSSVSIGVEQLRVCTLAISTCASQHIRN